MERLNKLLERLDFQVVQKDTDIEISELVYDSRKVVPGCLFVCVKGMAVDGHTFVEEVAQKGAAAVVVQEEVEAPENLTVIRVQDTRYALALLSCAWFHDPAEKLKVIGITGTKGKTTTTYMVKSILESAGYKTGLIGTIEAVIGEQVIPANNTTPESYIVQDYFHQMVEAGCQCVVMEVSSQGLMMHRTAGFTFEIGIFTNMEPDHIGPGEHASFEEYMSCKSMLFRQCRIGIVNVDDKHWEQVLKDHTCTMETYGFSEEADLRAVNPQLVKKPGYLGVAYTAQGLVNAQVEVDVPGKFSIYNSLTAIAICRHFQVNTQNMKEALKKARVKGRIDRKSVV